MDAIGPRRWRRHALLTATGVALTLGAIGVAIGPAAPWIIDHVSDGAPLGRMGKLHIDGVRGSWLGDLHVDHLTVSDARGTWAEARDVSVQWRPFDLILMSHTWLNNAHAGLIHITRQPVLSEAGPAHDAKFHVNIDALRIDRLTLEQPVVGAYGDFTVTAKLDASNDAIGALDLSVHRLDSEADHVNVHLSTGDAFALHADIGSDAGGVLVHALGAPDHALLITADGAGANGAGSAQLHAKIGDQSLADGVLQWSAEHWSVQGDARLDVLPATHAIAERFGWTLNIASAGAPHGAITAHVASPNLAVDLAGRLNEQWALDGPARIVATTPRISSIGYEAPFELGAGRFEGTLTQRDGASVLEGALEGRDLNVLDRRAHVSGPVRAELNQTRFLLQADLHAVGAEPALFDDVRLQTHLSYDRDRGRFKLESATITSAAAEVTAQGWANDGDGEFSGTWRLKQANALFDGLRGQASGRYRAFAAPRTTGARVWTTAIDGVGEHIAGQPDIVPQLLGATPRLDGLFRFENNGVSVDHLRIDAAQLRAAATGRIVHGIADLKLEASARGPLHIGDAQIAGAVDATGRVTGRLARPSLRAQAQLASFTAAGIDISQPNVTFTLEPAGSAYRGQAQMQGRYQEQVVDATSGVEIVNNELRLPGLIAHVATLEARGDAVLSPRGASAQLALSGGLDGLAPGLTGRMLGHAALTPQTVTLDAQIADARAGDLRIRSATLTANGPYHAIAATFDMRGRLRQAPLAFHGDAVVHALQQGTDISIQGTGALANAPISTRTPMVLQWRGSTLDAAIDVALADGGLTAHWNERARVLQGAVTVGETPIAPLAAIFGERASGRIGGTVALNNAGGGLAGDANLHLIDARFEGRQRGLLTGTMVAHLDPTRLTAEINAQSSDGLVAHFQAEAPVSTSSSPIRIALEPERRGHATWNVRGPAGSLWAAARLQDQDLEGDLTGEGQLSFGAGYLAGDGRIEIANGRFEDKITGVKLQNLSAAVGIDQNGVTIQHFTAQDSRGGTVSATGGSASPTEGQITLDVHDLRLVDRPDARARASGRIALVWHGMDSTLSGDLAIAEADINIAQNPQAGIATLNVVEINRPGDEDDQPDAPTAPRAGATKVDVRIRAMDRVFTRGRGVNAEWALDLRLGGTSAAPLLYGEAQALRGTLSLSGQPFEIDEGKIFFNGDPLDARINLTATRDTADLTAHITLTGTAAQPDVSFTSSPALPEDEILPQILFGHSVEDLNAIEAAQLAASLAALSGQASFNLVDAARAAAGLDRFDVRQDANGGFLVAGGVYLTREVYLEVARTGLGQASTRVEWTIRPKLVLITSFLVNGDQRASIRWRRESN